jgi:pentatricopeptide repeat protein
MPLCAARHVKLVAEAEQLLLPFLAPRVFQPWPRSANRSSHSSSFFSTTSCEHDESRLRRARVQKNAKGDKAGHVSSTKERLPRAHVEKERLPRAHVQKAYLQRLTTSQAIVKSRWTVANRNDNNLRTKWVKLGRPVRRVTQNQQGQTKDVVILSPDGDTLYWNHHFAKLNARHDTTLTHRHTPSTVPNLNFRAQKWAARILHSNGFKHLDELAALLGHNWQRKWMHALLWTLANSVQDTIRFLELTHTSPYLPAAYITDALTYYVSFYTHSDMSDDARNHLLNVLCTLLERPGTSPLQLSSGTLRHVLALCSKDQVLQLYHAITENGTLLHWNSRLHLSSCLAQHGRFDQALDTLLDAVLHGADVKSLQFESRCADMLRKAANQPDGLRVSLRLVQNLSDIGVQLNLQLCNIVMLNAVEAHDLKTAFTIYHSLVDNNLKADEYTHAILLKGCKTLIEDSDNLNTAIRQAIADVEVQRLDVVATEIVHCLYLHHSQIDPENAYSIVSDAFSQLFDTSQLIHLGMLPERYQNKSMSRMKPTLSALGIMMGAYLRHTVQLRSHTSKDIHGMYRQWRSLVEHGVRPYVHLARQDYIFNSFLKAFAHDVGGLGHAAEVIRDMQTPLSGDFRQATPTVQSWSIFLHGFAKHGKMELAEQVLAYMRKRDMLPNEVTWNSLLGGYIKLGRSNEAVETFVRMRDAGFEADEVTQTHFGKIKLDSVKASAWNSGDGSKRAVEEAEQEEQQHIEALGEGGDDVDTTTDKTDEVVDGVHSLSM